MSIKQLKFTVDGLLPPWDYPMSINELCESLLVCGPLDKGANNPWDETWRRELVSRAAVLVDQLWRVGVTEIFLDGSFVEDKAHPNDIDGYFECDLRQLASGELQRRLNELDPHKIWTWDPRARRGSRGFAKRQLPMWHEYRIELYPHTPEVLTGILDENGMNLPFPAAFRRERASGRPKGIIKVVP